MKVPQLTDAAKADLNEIWISIAGRRFLAGNLYLNLIRWIEDW